MAAISRVISDAVDAGKVKSEDSKAASRTLARTIPSAAKGIDVNYTDRKDMRVTAEAWAPLVWEG